MVQPEALAVARFLAPLCIPSAVFLLPIVLVFWFRTRTLRSPEALQKEVWARFRVYVRFILMAAVTGWWAVWGLDGSSEFVHLHFDSISAFLPPSMLKTMLFWIPPVLSLGVFLLTCYAVDRTLLKLRWSASNMLWRTWWRLVGFVVPLLMIATGCEALIDRQIRGVAWFFGAGLVARIGTGISRHAEGVKLNTLKSGEIRNRVLHLAKEMGVTLRRVYVVPAGKGHLTNAYGGSSAIGLTDNLGKFLTREQTDYVIAHELSHAKLKHGRKETILVLGTYACIAPLLFFLPRPVSQVRPLLSVAIIMVPFLLTCWFSRRFEFAADQEAIDFTRDPESAIRALAILRQTAELPAQSTSITKLFMTHPPFNRRISAIAFAGDVPQERLHSILLNEGIAESEVPRAR